MRERATKIGREQGLEQGIEQGIEKGRVEGIEVGKRVGFMEGQLEGRAEGIRQATLDGALARFDPSARIYKELQTLLESVSDIETLQTIFNMLFSVENMQHYVDAARKQLA